MQTKICSKCGIEKNIIQFGYVKTTGKYKSQCKECGREYRKELYRKQKGQKNVKNNRVSIIENQQRIEIKLDEIEHKLDLILNILTKDLKYDIINEKGDIYG